MMKNGCKKKDFTSKYLKKIRENFEFHCAYTPSLLIDVFHFYLDHVSSQLWPLANEIDSLTSRVSALDGKYLSFAKRNVGPLYQHVVLSQLNKITVERLSAVKERKKLVQKMLTEAAKLLPFFYDSENKLDLKRMVLFNYIYFLPQQQILSILLSTLDFEKNKKFQDMLIAVSSCGVALHGEDEFKKEVVETLLNKAIELAEKNENNECIDLALEALDIHTSEPVVAHFHTQSRLLSTASMSLRKCNKQNTSITRRRMHN